MWVKLTTAAYSTNIFKSTFSTKNFKSMFIVPKYLEQLYCTYSLGWYCFGKRKTVKNLLISYWWNWCQAGCDYKYQVLLLLSISNRENRLEMTRDGKKVLFTFMFPLTLQTCVLSIKWQGLKCAKKVIWLFKRNQISNLKDNKLAKKSGWGKGVTFFCHPWRNFNFVRFEINLVLKLTHPKKLRKEGHKAGLEI